MARKSTGSIIERATSRGPSLHVRFVAGGKRQSVHVGYAADGATRTDAERVLAFELERVRRGEWAPPVVQQSVRDVPTFREAASDWFAGRKVEGGRNGSGLRERSVADLEWRLGHLLREFAATPIDRIDVAAVDGYRRRMVKRGLSARSVNMTLACLAAVLDEALEQGVITGRNPAVGKRRRLKAERPSRTYLDRAEQIEALLDAAGELDGEAHRQGVAHRRAALATLVLAGLRIGELLDLRWSNVHLGSGRLSVRGGKTAAAERKVDLLPLLRDELVLLAADHRREEAPDAYVFATSEGNRQGATNVRRRILAPAVKRANEALAKREAEPMPERLTPHSLRRTFASLLYALGATPPYVMAQMGHRSSNLALEMYARSVDRAEPQRLAVLVGAPHRATAGDGTPVSESVEREKSEAEA
jgi:integrase